MSLTHVQNLLLELDLRGALEQFNIYVNNPKELEATSVDNILVNMFTHEINTRNIRKQESLIKVSRLPIRADISMISKDNERNTAIFINKLQMLSTLEFVEKGYNLTIYGRAGSGKTFVGSALGRRNCQLGNSTLYYSTKELLNYLHIALGSVSYASRLKTISGKSMLILDDFCLTSYTAEEKGILFDVLDKRYSKKSTVILSQKSPDAWIDILKEGNAGDSLSESIVERCSNNNYTLIMPGTSRRTSVESDINN